MQSKGMLVAVQFPVNSGYAIEPLERSFYEMALAITGAPHRVHFAYRNLDGGAPRALPTDFGNVIAFDARSGDAGSLEFIQDYVRLHQIGGLFGFDLPVASPSYAPLRRAGVHTIVSYWGAPMSTLNSGIKLLLKRLDVRLRRHQPDHYVFESRAIQRTAVEGRGIPIERTSVVPLGVDAKRFAPLAEPDWHAHDAFDIPRQRKLIVYSGHMQARKGVDVIIRAAVELIDRRARDDVHFLFLGNKPGEEAPYAPLYRGSRAERHISFGGYRGDLDRILPSCDVGCIASTGWDSFPRSAVEMAACGLPLVVSRLQGLVETVEDGVTGYLVPPGDADGLADRLAELLDAPDLRRRMGEQARRRILRGYTLEVQRHNLIARVWEQLPEQARSPAGVSATAAEPQKYCRSGS